MGGTIGDMGDMESALPYCDTRRGTFLIFSYNFICDRDELGECLVVPVVVRVNSTPDGARQSQNLELWAEDLGTHNLRFIRQNCRQGSSTVQVVLCLCPGTRRAKYLSKGQPLHAPPGRVK